MRRLFFLLLTFSAFLPMLLCSCTVQDEMNAAILAERFCERGGYLPASDEMIFDGNKALFFAENEAGTTVLLGMRTAESGSVESVSASVDFTLEKSREAAYSDFTAACSLCTEVYAPDDFAQYSETAKALSLTGKLAGDVTAYHDTQWYRYAAIITADSAYFSVESKRAVPDTGVEYSLKQ